MEKFLGVSSELLVVIAIMFSFIIILFIININNGMKIKKLKKKYLRFMSGLGNGNIEDLLEESMKKADINSQRISDIVNHLNKIDRNLMQCTQKVGVVRYNAFENLGSDLSFSIALLDNNDSGLILSGIYSRDSSATFAKPVTNGKSKYSLSLEEIQALEIAKKNFNENLLTT